MCQDQAAHHSSGIGLGTRSRTSPRPLARATTLELSDVYFDQVSVEVAINELRTHLDGLVHFGCDLQRRKDVEVTIMKLIHLHDSLDITFFKELSMRADVNNVDIKRIPYKVNCMLNMFMYAELLRNDNDLREALVAGLAILLPPNVQGAFANLVQNAVNHDLVPSPAMISRYRLLLDGAEMLVRRNVFAAGLDFVHYLQADSSTQRKQEFQHIVLRSIPTDVLLDLARWADELYRIAFFHGWL